MMALLPHLKFSDQRLKTQCVTKDPKSSEALTSVAQWAGRHPKWKVTVWFPTRAYAWVTGSLVLFGACERGNQFLFLCHTDVSLPLSPALYLSLKTNKQNLKKTTNKNSKSFEDKENWVNDSTLCPLQSMHLHLSHFQPLYRLRFVLIVTSLKGCRLSLTLLMKVGFNLAVA